MIPSITHAVALDCPTCGCNLTFNLTESMLIPPRASVPLQLEDGHELNLDTTHYAKSNQVVSRLIMVVITHCPGESTKSAGEESTQSDPWLGTSSVSSGRLHWTRMTVSQEVSNDPRHSS